MINILKEPSMWPAFPTQTVLWGYQITTEHAVSIWIEESTKWIKKEWEAVTLYDLKEIITIVSVHWWLLLSQKGWQQVSCPMMKYVPPSKNLLSKNPKSPKSDYASISNCQSTGIVYSISHIFGSEEQVKWYHVDVIKKI